MCAFVVYILHVEPPPDLVAALAVLDQVVRVEPKVLAADWLLLPVPPVARGEAVSPQPQLPDHRVLLPGVREGGNGVLAGGEDVVCGLGVVPEPHDLGLYPGDGGPAVLTARARLVARPRHSAAQDCPRLGGDEVLHDAVTCQQYCK